jgi:hypothetical protein
MFKNSVKRVARLVGVAVASIGIGATMLPGVSLAGEDYQSRHFMTNWNVHPASHTGPALLNLQQMTGILNWSPINKGTLDGRNLRQFKYVSHRPADVAQPWGGCMDSKGVASGGRPGTVGCNNGNYQVWQIFRNSNGSLTFKNLGSWTEQGRHLCLGVDTSRTVKMLTCNANSSLQQWV